MAAFESWFRQDLKKPVAVRQLTGNLFSADNAANLIGVEILNDDAPAEISGAVMGYVIRSDGATVLVQGTLEGNKCSVTLPLSCYAVIGQISIVIKLGTTTVLACTGYVYKTTTDAIIDPGSVIPSISELLEKIDEMEQGTAAAEEAATAANTAATNANTKAGLAETAAGNANTAAGKINNMTVEATTLSAGSEATVSITEDQVDGHKHIVFGVPKGVSGNETIDDTAGEGDTDKVWSADKSYAEITQLKNNVIVESASGSIASFADGADGMPLRSLSVAIEPVQDLHGYDSPWPGGGGKNLLEITETSQTINGVTFSVNADGTITANGTATDAVNFYINSGLVLPIGNYLLTGAPDGSSNTYLLYANSPYNAESQGSLEGRINVVDETPVLVRIVIRSGITVNNAKLYPMIRLASESDATFAPYSNICPISGWTGAKVTRTGKNLLPVTVEKIKALNAGRTWDGNSCTFNGVTFTIQADSDGNLIGIAVNGTASSEITFWLLGGNWGYSPSEKNIIRKGLSYVLSDGVSQSRTRVAISVYDRNGTNALGYEWNLVRPLANIPDDDELGYLAYIRIYNNETANNLVFKPMIRLASETATAYEPYSGNTYDISFPSSAGTVYGGTLDVATGVLTVTHASELIKDVPWSYQTALGGYFRAYSSNVENIVKLADAGQTDALCSCYKTAQAGTSSALEALDKVYIAGGSASVYRLIIKDTDYTTVSDFVAARGEERLTYELRVPVTHTLTQQEVKTLLGDNNIWADTGNVTLEYPADTKIYIDRKFAELQALILENISNS